MAFGFPLCPVLPQSHINAAPLPLPSLTYNHQEGRGKPALFPSPVRAPLLTPHVASHNFSYYLPPQPSVTHLLPSAECAIPGSWLFPRPGGQFHLGEGGRVSSRCPGCPPCPPHLPPHTVNIWGSQALSGHGSELGRCPGQAQGKGAPPSTDNWPELMGKCPHSLSTRGDSFQVPAPRCLSEVLSGTSLGCPMVTF